MVDLWPFLCLVLKSSTSQPFLLCSCPTSQSQVLRCGSPLMWLSRLIWKSTYDPRGCAGNKELWLPLVSAPCWLIFNLSELPHWGFWDSSSVYSDLHLQRGLEVIFDPSFPRAWSLWDPAKEWACLWFSSPGPISYMFLSGVYKGAQWVISKLLRYRISPKGVTIH